MFSGSSAQAENLVILSINDDIFLPISTLHVAVAVGAKDAAIGHQQHGVGGRLGFVVAFDRQSSGSTEGVRLREANADVVAKLNQLVVAKHERRRDLTTIDTGPCQRFEDVSAGVAADYGVATRQIGEDGQGNTIAGRWLADRDGVVQANQKAADGIDPHERSLWFIVADHGIDLTGAR